MDTDTTGGVGFVSVALGTGTLLLERSSYGGNVTICIVINDQTVISYLYILRY